MVKQMECMNLMEQIRTDPKTSDLRLLNKLVFFSSFFYVNIPFLYRCLETTSYMGSKYAINKLDFYVRKLVQDK